MGNSLWRLQTVLNLTANAVETAGMTSEVEIIITDWGSERWLADDLCLSAVAARLTRFINVTPEIVRDLKTGSPFSEVHALNCAARRASGLFIGRIDQDTLVTTNALKVIKSLSQGRAGLPAPATECIYFSERREVPMLAVKDSPHPATVESALSLFGSRLSVDAHLHAGDNHYWRNGVGIWMTSRESWFDCRGYDETYVFRNAMEIEMIMRLLEKHPVVNFGPMTNYGFHHLGHEQVKEGNQGRKVQDNPYLNPELITQFSPNSSSWGLGDFNLPFSTVSPRELPTFSTPSSPSYIRPIEHWTKFVLRFFWRQLVDLLQLIALFDSKPASGTSKTTATFRQRYAPRNLYRHLMKFKRRIISKD